MIESTGLVWKGERNRELNVYRTCSCCVCWKSRKGIGYLSFSDVNGRGFTIWIEDEQVFRRLRRALRHFRKEHTSRCQRSLPGNLRAICTNCSEGLQNTAPPKPDRIKLLTQARRATIDDQLHLLRWLRTKFEKIRPEKK